MKLPQHETAGTFLKTADSIHIAADSLLPKSAENTRVALGVGFLPLKMAAHFADKVRANFRTMLEGGQAFDLDNK